MSECDENVSPIDLNRLLIATRHNLDDWQYDDDTCYCRKAYHTKLNVTIGEVEMWNDGWTSFFCWTYMSRALYLHRADGSRIRVPVDKKTERTIKRLLDKLDEHKDEECERRMIKMSAVEVGNGNT